MRQKSKSTHGNKTPDIDRSSGEKKDKTTNRPNMVSINECAQKTSKSSKEFVKKSSLYQEFLVECEEILRHKWLESERIGHDIGFERALLDWIRKHREDWRGTRRADSSNCASAAK